MKMETQQPKCMGLSKTVLRGRFAVINFYIKKKKSSQINNLNLQLRELEKEETKPKFITSKEKNKYQNKNM